MEYRLLPEEILGPQPKELEENCINFLRDTMGKFKFGDAIAEGSLRSYVRVKAHWRKHKEPPIAKIKRRLSRKDRKKYDLAKLPKTGWNYNALQPMRTMWLQYMRNNLAGLKVPTCTDEDPSNYFNFYMILGKSELAGAHVKVLRSRVPNNIDIEGVIVLETRQTFQVVTPKNELKILLKEPSVFSIEMDKLTLTIYGAALQMRPQERCIKKIKTCIDLNL